MFTREGKIVLTVCRDIINILGLSERLEVQEMFENLQEERLDNLQDDLVTCINGEEGQGGEPSPPTFPGSQLKLCFRRRSGPG